MSTEFYSFSFRQNDFIFGIIELGGFDEGDDVVTIAMDKDQWTKKVGAKGDVVRVQTNDNSGVITVKLLQTSKTNALLMAAYNVDRESGVGAVPFISRNKETGETYVCKNSWITKAPDIVRGQDANTMEWVLNFDFIVHLIIT